MEKILDDLMNDVDRIVSKPVTNFHTLEADRKKTVLTCALHCCINGPVGVNKRTTFPIVGDIRLKDILQCSNRSWKSLCLDVANYLVTKGIKLDCNAINRLKTYWPIKDW